MPTLIQLFKKLLPHRVKSYIRRNVYQPTEESAPGLQETLSFSQAGEDAILRFLFLDYPMSLDKISYLDIGARHPTSGSNSYLLYSFGSSGVCVEADKSAIPAIQQIRPRDKVLNVGISTSGEEFGDFYFLEGGGSTFDKEEAEKRESLNDAIKILEVIKVPLLSINKLIEQNFETYPVFLSIDIEGLDLPVLKTLDFDKYPIPVICAETCMYSPNHVRPKDKTIAEFLLSKGYEVYGDTYINTIFVNKKWFYN